MKHITIKQLFSSSIRSFAQLRGGALIMKSNRFKTQIVLFSIFIIMAISFTCIAFMEGNNSIYYVSGLSDYDYNDNGAVGYIEFDPYNLPKYQYARYSEAWIYKNKVPAYIPEGTAVHVNTDILNDDNSSETYVSTYLICFNDLQIFIPKSNLIAAKEYNSSFYDPPQIFMSYREAMYKSLDVHDNTILMTLNPGCFVTVVAAFDDNYLVCYDNMYGFIRQDGLFSSPDTYLRSESKKRIYDSHLKFYDSYYIPSFSAEKTNVDKAEAVEIARQSIMPLLGETIDIDDLSCFVELNAAHEKTPLGTTWQIVFYGERNINDTRDIQYFVIFDDWENTITQIPSIGSSASSIHDLTEEDWNSIRNFLGADIENRYVYYIVEVSIDTGIATVVDHFIQTPDLRISIFR